MYAQILLIVEIGVRTVYNFPFRNQRGLAVYREIEFRRMARKHRFTYSALRSTKESGEEALEKLENELRSCVKRVKGGGKRKVPAKESCWHFHFDGKTGKRSRTTRCPPSKGFSKRTPSQCIHTHQQLDNFDGTAGHIY